MKKKRISFIHPTLIVAIIWGATQQKELSSIFKKHISHVTPAPHMRNPGNLFCIRGSVKERATLRLTFLPILIHIHGEKFVCLIDKPHTYSQIKV